MLQRNGADGFSFGSRQCLVRHAALLDASHGRPHRFASTVAGKFAGPVAQLDRATVS
jgi:hypothetical protein